MRYLLAPHIFPPPPLPFPPADDGFQRNQALLGESGFAPTKPQSGGGNLPNAGPPDRTTPPPLFSPPRLPQNRPHRAA